MQIFSNKSLVPVRTKTVMPERPAPPKGALLLGVVGGQRCYLTRRDRSYHLLIIGAIGTGKTVTLESITRCDIAHGEGGCVMDRMGALYQRVLNYCCFRKAAGLRLPEIILFNPSADEWVLPYNPFVRRNGELSVQVDRRVAATVRVWGVSNTQFTPRLEKWLKVIYSALISGGLTIEEAAWIIDQRSQDIRAYLSRALSSPLLQRKLDQLSLFKTTEFYEQLESVENRLMRFLSSEHLSRIFGSGGNVLDFRDIMDRRKHLLINLQPSSFLSEEQSSMIGTFILSEVYETALQRPSGAVPWYCKVDEAANFVTPELAQATEQCRQKGVHFTFAFQHLAQFRQEGERVAKAFMHIRNKLILAVPERQDALELAGDLFTGLTKPQLKFMHRRLSHLIEDVQRTATTEAAGTSSSWTSSRSESHGLSVTAGSSRGRNWGSNESTASGRTAGRTFTRGQSDEAGTSTSHSRNEHEAHSSGFSETRTRQQSSTRSGNKTEFKRQTDRLLFSEQVVQTSDSKGASSSESSGYSRTETGSDSYDRGESWTESENESHGRSSSLAFSRTQQTVETTGTSRGQTREQNRSRTNASSQTAGQSTERGQNRSHATTMGWGTRHTPFIEEDPEHWTLQEQQWRAAELLMRQQTGHWFLATATTVGFGRTMKPRSYYLSPTRQQQIEQQFYATHNLPKAAAEQARIKRQQEFLAQAQAFARTTVQQSRRVAARSSAVNGQTADAAPPIWNRAFTASAPAPPLLRGKRRGPKTDVEKHTKVAAIIQRYGQAWTSDENLLSICEQLDAEAVPVPKTWPSRKRAARTWLRGLQHDPSLVVKALRYHVDAARRSENDSPT